MARQDMGIKEVMPSTPEIFDPGIQHGCSYAYPSSLLFDEDHSHRGDPIDGLSRGKATGFSQDEAEGVVVYGAEIYPTARILKTVQEGVGHGFGQSVGPGPHWVDGGHLGGEAAVQIHQGIKVGRQGRSSRY